MRNNRNIVLLFKKVKYKFYCILCYIVTLFVLKIRKPVSYFLGGKMAKQKKAIFL